MRLMPVVLVAGMVAVTPDGTDGTGTDYRPGDGLPQVWGTESTNERTFYATWRNR